jgi:hypothetical protein
MAGTQNKALLLHMGVSETSYASRRSPGH